MNLFRLKHVFLLLTEIYIEYSVLVMDNSLYEEIVQFVTKDIYPEAVRVSRRDRWNFKRKCSCYSLGESHNLLKVF